MGNIDLNNYDVTVKVCDFTTPSKSAGKIIDESYMTTHVLNNDRWRNKLRNGHVLGLFSHKGRQPREQIAEIPYEDNMAISPYLCNYAKDVWVSNGALYAGLNLFSEKEYGKLLKDMLSKKINVPVSMSVKAHADVSKYYVDDLLGIDFTFRPDLAAEVINVNFSNEDSSIEGIYHFSFIPDEKDVQVNPRIVNNVKNTIEKDHPESTVVNFREPIVDTIRTKRDQNKALRELDAEDDVYEIYVKPDVLPKLKDLKFSFTRDTKLVNGYVAVKIRNLSKLTDSQLDFIQENDSSFSEQPLGSNLELLENSLGRLNVDNNTVKNYVDDVNKSISTEYLMSFIESQSDEMLNFSLQQYLQELRLAPHQVLNRRINEVIRMINSKKQEWVIQKSPLMKSYIDTYVLKWVQDILNNPNEDFNIILGLRLGNYNINRKLLMDLQRCLNRTKATLMSTSIMPPNLQKEVNQKFQSVMVGIYEFINSKCVLSGNRLI